MDDDDGGTFVGPIRPVPDVGTRVRALDEDPRLPPSAAAEAWASLVPGLARMPAPDAPSFRLFWRTRDRTGFRDFAMRAGNHFIVGRHSRCDVVLADDAEISLRHLLLVPSGAALRLVDLRAGLPMLLDDDTPSRSLDVDGGFALRLGRYVIGGFAVGPDAPEPAPAMPILERVQEHEHPTPEGGPYRAFGRTSAIERKRTLTLVETIDRPPSAYAMLVAAREGERARLPIAREDLERGVLVGREERCAVESLRPLLVGEISRVHAVLLETAGTTWLYDCASSNGTWVAKERIRSIALDDDAPVVRLAGRGGLELRWTRLSRGEEER